MSPRPRTSETLTVSLEGAVSGAVTDFYRSPDANISLNWSPVISVPVGSAGGFDHPNFQQTAINLGSIRGGIGVLSGSLSANLPANGGVQISAGFHALVGGEVTLIIPSLWPSTWDVSANASGRAAVGLNVGAFGFGIGGVVEGTIDDGRAGINGTYDMVILGVNAGYSTRYPLSTASGNNSNRQPAPSTPSDTTIQTSRDIVAGKLFDKSTVQTIYPDAAIRQVAAGQNHASPQPQKVKDAAPSAAWQQEYNRDRQYGGGQAPATRAMVLADLTAKHPVRFALAA